MALKTAVWKVSQNGLTPLPKGILQSEKLLEDWIEQDVSLLDLPLLIIGRQVRTVGGPIDLLALDNEANVVVVELKRDKTPREVVAQALDYAGCVKAMSYADLTQLYDEYAKCASDKNLREAFRDYFGFALPETINKTHSVVIVASQLDDSSERIVKYLQDEYGININVVYFNFFRSDGLEVLARSWLADPEQTAEQSQQRNQTPWLGYWFVNVGENEQRNWDDCRRYGFLSAGGGRRYSGALEKLAVGDLVFAYMKQRGYVGFGRVLETVVPVSHFQVNGQSILDLPLEQKGLAHDVNDLEQCDYLVRIEWLQTTLREDAQTFSGAFANQNIVCKLRDQTTVDFLKQRFNVVENS